MITDNLKSQHGREELKGYFRNGVIPTEKHFEFLIDSTINKLDDGFSKDENSGYILTPLGSSSRLITFYKNMDRLEPLFYLEKDEQQSPSLRFVSGLKNPDAHQDDNELAKDDKSIFFHQNGNIGIGSRCEENHKLEVNGFLATKGRLGTFASGTVPANGKWHDVIKSLDNCQAFEVMARAGIKRTGKFSMLHAIALNAFGESTSKINKTRSYFGFFWNRLNIKWEGSTHDYALKLKSCRNFGKNAVIHYRITKLWDDELFTTDQSFYAPGETH
ncbi:MAG: hypothetical protein ACKVOK_04015 [Flavobacteriales bacterium]